MTTTPLWLRFLTFSVDFFYFSERWGGRFTLIAPIGGWRCYMQSQTPPLLDGLLTFAVFFAVCVGWYFVYVRPADAVREAVMVCMAERGDISREVYDACLSDVRGEM